MVANNLGISSALDVPVVHGSKEAESAFLVHLVCLVCLVFWLNETNQMNQINQINKTNQINLRQAPTGCEEKWNSGCSRCAAFCSRGVRATVVIRVSIMCATSGKCGTGETRRFEAAPFSPVPRVSLG
jgi:hypothetical protein